jgi:hypothetical protein
MFRARKITFSDERPNQAPARPPAKISCNLLVDVARSYLVAGEGVKQYLASVRWALSKRKVRRRDITVNIQALSLDMT